MLARLQTRSTSAVRTRRKRALEVLCEPRGALRRVHLQRVQLDPPRGEERAREGVAVLVAYEVQDAALPLRRALQVCEDVLREELPRARLVCASDMVCGGEEGGWDSGGQRRRGVRRGRGGRGRRGGRERGGCGGADDVEGSLCPIYGFVKTLLGDLKCRTYLYLLVCWKTPVSAQRPSMPRSCAHS